MGQIRKTIQMLTTAGISASVLILSVGCADTNTPVQSNANGVRGDVTDVHPMLTATPASYQPPLYDSSGTIPTTAQPITSQTVATVAPAPDTSADTLISTTPSSKTLGGAGKRHTVRKGETLYSIAKVSYGNGKMWKKIEAANPGVTPAKLKVGQVLTLPA